MMSIFFVSFNCTPATMFPSTNFWDANKHISFEKGSDALAYHSNMPPGVQIHFMQHVCRDTVTRVFGGQEEFTREINVAVHKERYKTGDCMV
jgi:hypothetical protein